MIAAQQSNSNTKGNKNNRHMNVSLGAASNTNQILNGQVNGSIHDVLNSTLTNYSLINSEQLKVHLPEIMQQ